MMKKLFLGIIVFGLLFCNIAFSKNSLLEERIPVGSTKKHMCYAILDKEVFDSNDLWCHGLNEKYYSYLPSQNTEIITIKNNKGIHFVFENVTKRMNCFNLMCNKGTGTLRGIAYSKQEALIFANNKKYAEFIKKEEKKKEEKEKAIASADLTFTIKDKKEQCEAIGYALATEKFADCVLELVVLDVKSQQTAQIALAQSQGNQQLAEQLKKQNNSRSSDAFINLGLKLLSPQSTVSAPTTTNCRVIGSGAYKTVNCW